MRRNRKKRPIGMLIIIVSSIIMVNLLGVSYAHWNDNVSITTSIRTGDIYPYFIENGNSISDNLKASNFKEMKGEAKGVEKDKSMGEISARFINENTLEISGWCYPSYSESIAVKFGNDGSIPIVYKGMDAEDDDEIIQQIQFNGTNIKENDKKMKYKNQDMIDKKDAEELEIHIQAGNEGNMEYGNHSFNYQLQFGQGLR
jgi:hypothetical protein